jgi:DNA-directed RNA polymerase subunit RPC12/RpoP
MKESHRQVIGELRRGQANLEYLSDQIPGRTEAVVDELIQNGFVDEIAGAGLYKLVEDPAESDSWFHLICDECGHRTEITIPAMKVESNIDTTEHIECPDCGKTTRHAFVGVSPP